MQLADLPPNFVGPVSEGRRSARVGLDQRYGRAGCEPVIAVAAGLAHHHDRDLQPRTRDQPVLDRLLDPQVRAAGIADRRDPDRQRCLQVPRRLIELVRERLLGNPPYVDARDRHVRVAVEQAGQDRPVAEVDLFVAVETGADRHDPIFLDGDVGSCRIGARAVKHVGTTQDDPAHRVSSVSSGSSRARNRSIPPSSAVNR